MMEPDGMGHVLAAFNGITEQYDDSGKRLVSAVLAVGGAIVDSIDRWRRDDRDRTHASRDAEWQAAFRKAVPADAHTPSSPRGVERCIRSLHNG